MIRTRKIIKNPIILGGLGLLAASFGIAWYIRVNYWPCGRFDSTSGCVSSVKLQTEVLGFEDENIRLNFRSLDLASGGETALVGFRGIRVEQGTKGQTDKRHLYAIVALFNTRDGRLIRVLRELKGGSKEDDGEAYNEPDDRLFDGVSLTQDVALSEDGSLAASYGIGENENSLIVQRTADGSKVKTIFARRDSARRGCYSMLDFSKDNKVLQCRSTLHWLDSDQYKRLVDKEGNYIYPFIADSSLTTNAVAPDGTRIRYRFSALSRSGFMVTAPGSVSKRIEPRLNLPGDADHDFMFSPDSQLFMEGYTNLEVNGIQHLMPPPFRKLSGVAIWTRNAELKRMFFTNKRYRNFSWSRDSKHFALLNTDLSLQVFKAP